MIAMEIQQVHLIGLLIMLSSHQAFCYMFRTALPLYGFLVWLGGQRNIVENSTLLCAQ